MTHPQCSAGTETVETLREKLQDPIAVHLNMLRGEIAKPSWANIKHLYPEQFPDEPQAVPAKPPVKLTKACERCEGDGYVRRDANLPDVKCPDCNGWGYSLTRPRGG